MSTMSFSIEDDIKRDFAGWAKRAKKSKSDLFRDMVKIYRFNHELEAFSRQTESVLAEVGIETEAELYEYLGSDETYKDRLRQQRLSRRDQKG